VVGGAKWIIYWNGAKLATRLAEVNQKNLVVVARFGGGMAKSQCYLGGDEGVETKGRACRPLPPPNGGIWQLKWNMFFMKA